VVERQKPRPMASMYAMKSGPFEIGRVNLICGGGTAILGKRPPQGLLAGSKRPELVRRPPKSIAARGCLFLAAVQVPISVVSRVVEVVDKLGETVRHGPISRRPLVERCQFSRWPAGANPSKFTREVGPLRSAWSREDQSPHFRTKLVMQFLPSGQYCMTRIGTLPNRLSLFVAFSTSSAQSRSTAPLVLPPYP
jgi:hypothetical protein